MNLGNQSAGIRFHMVGQSIGANHELIQGNTTVLVSDIRFTIRIVLDGLPTCALFDVFAVLPVIVLVRDFPVTSQNYPLS